MSVSGWLIETALSLVFSSRNEMRPCGVCFYLKAYFTLNYLVTIYRITRTVIGVCCSDLEFFQHGRQQVRREQHCFGAWPGLDWAASSWFYLSFTSKLWGPHLSRTHYLCGLTHLLSSQGGEGPGRDTEVRNWKHTLPCPNSHIAISQFPFTATVLHLSQSPTSCVSISREGCVS